jgi:hypothetical protein
VASQRLPVYLSLEEAADIIPRYGPVPFYAASGRHTVGAEA